MEVAFTGAVSVPGIAESCDYAKNVGRGGEEEGGYGAVAEGLDYGREEICYGPRGYDAKEHDHLRYVCQ